MKRIAILGSTGSIGRSTESVVESHPERFQITTLAAGRNVDRAFEQAQRWKPHLVSISAAPAADELRNRLKAAGLASIEVAEGSPGAVKVATHPEVDFV